jgi:hypothetical protein
MWVDAVQMWTTVVNPTEDKSSSYVALKQTKYSGTSVCIRFGISPTWYMSCLDVKNFVWNMTRARQNESCNFCVFSRKFFVNSLTMSFKKVNEKSQATKNMVRITMEAKKDTVEKYEGGIRIRTWLLHTVCRE